LILFCVSMQSMARKLTWQEMKKKYPNQWVSLINIERGKDGMVKSGVVMAAGPDLKIVTQKLKKDNLPSEMFKYTGHIKYFWGFAKWGITDVPIDG